MGLGFVLGTGFGLTGVGLGTGFGLTTGSTLGGIGGRGLGSGLGVTLTGGVGVGEGLGLVEEQSVAHWPLPIQRHEFHQAPLHNWEISLTRKENRHQVNEKIGIAKNFFSLRLKPIIDYSHRYKFHQCE